MYVVDLPIHDERPGPAPAGLANPAEINQNKFHSAVGE